MNKCTLYTSNIRASRLRLALRLLRLTLRRAIHQDQAHYLRKAAAAITSALKHEPIDAPNGGPGLAGPQTATGEAGLPRALPASPPPPLESWDA